MSLNKTLFDKAEAIWQFKENDQEKVFIGQIDICSYSRPIRKRLLRERKPSSITFFLSIYREAVKIKEYSEFHGKIKINVLLPLY